MDSTLPKGVLSAELEAALLRELVTTWKHLDWDLFAQALTLPTFELSESTSVLGRWFAHRRTIELSRDLVLDRPWGMVLEVLKHEMAHQYVTEVLGVRDETAHGPAFRDTCARFGIDASANGLPQPETASVARVDEERVLERVSKLLALAGSPNVHEAEAAMAAAQKLMLKYNLEHRAHGRTHGHKHRHIGVASGRITEAERRLATLLSQHFFVETIWVPVFRPRVGKRGTVLEICGTEANLDIAEYVYNYMMHTAHRLWDEHRRDRQVPGNRERRTFLAGVMSGFAGKLARQAVEHKTAGLVWVKDADLHEFLRARHPHVHTVRYGGGRRTDAFAHGKAAGEKIVLHRGVSGGAVARGRLLKA